MSPRKTPGLPLDCEIRAATLNDLSDIVEVWGELALHHAELDRAFAPSRRWREEYRQFISGLIGATTRWRSWR